MDKSRNQGNRKLTTQKIYSQLWVLQRSNGIGRPLSRLIKGNMKTHKLPNFCNERGQEWISLEVLMAFIYLFLSRIILKNIYLGCARS